MIQVGLLDPPACSDVCGLRCVRVSRQHLPSSRESLMSSLSEAHTVVVAVDADTGRPTAVNRSTGSKVGVHRGMAAATHVRCCAVPPSSTSSLIDSRNHPLPFCYRWALCQRESGTAFVLRQLLATRMQTVTPLHNSLGPCPASDARRPGWSWRSAGTGPVHST